MLLRLKGSQLNVGYYTRRGAGTLRASVSLRAVVVSRLSKCISRGLTIRLASGGGTLCGTLTSQALVDTLSKSECLKQSL